MSKDVLATNVNLKPNIHLLDADFDCYKLSLKPIPVLKNTYSFGLNVVSHKQHDFSYSKAFCFANHNYLAADKFNTKNVFFIDSSSRIRRYYVSKERIDPPESVFQLQTSSQVVEESEKLPPSLSFPSTSLCVASDGSGVFSIVKSGDRSLRSCDKWKLLYNNNSARPFVILDSFCIEKNNKKYVDVLTAGFKKTSQDSSTVVVLEWLSYESVDEKSTGDNSAYFRLENSRIFEGKSYPSHCTFVSEKGISLASEHPFHYKPKSNHDIPKNTNENSISKKEDNNKTSTPAKFKWKQTDEDVELIFPVEKHVTKQHVVCNFSSSNIVVAVKNDLLSEPVELLSGSLHMPSDPEASSWILQDSCLVVTIQKLKEGYRWSQVVIVKCLFCYKIVE